MGDPESNPPPETPEPRTRPVGGTEHSWCRAVPTGTGITVLALLLSKPPDIAVLQSAVNKLQISHPILRSKLHFDSTAAAFSFVMPPAPHIQVQAFDLSSTSHILETLPDDNSTFPHRTGPHHLILEHELNRNTWLNYDHPSKPDTELLFVSVYALTDAQWAVVLRLHTSICDRASAVALLRDLLEVLSGEWTQKEYEEEMEVSLGIENFIPAGKANKPFWARGVDMLGYSLNSFRLSNLNFLDVESERYSRVVRLQMSTDETEKLLEGCKTRGIKLCGALAAAGLIAAHSSKNLPEYQREMYAVVTLIDCRSILEPALASDHLGFYHSAILNTHDISGGEKLWELAKRCYTSFSDAKNCNKHFTDMSDLNFLMCKAIENPGLTPSSSQRTAFISVFEDPVIGESNQIHGEIGVEDYVGCSSVHGVGPSIAIFDTIRDGKLDCACVYPSPLHSRELMQQLVDDMKKILVEVNPVNVES